MSGLKAKVLKFALEADCAAAQSRETFHQLEAKVTDQLPLNEFETLDKRKAQLLSLWSRAAKGNIQGTTFLGKGSTQQLNLAHLLDALLSTLQSKAMPLDDGKLLTFWSSVVTPSPEPSQEVLDNTINLVALFEESVANVLYDPLHEAASIERPAIARVVDLAQRCLEQVYRRSLMNDPAHLSILVADSRVTYSEALDMLQQSIDQLRTRLPKAPHVQNLSDEDSLVKLAAAAEAVQRIAGRLPLVFSDDQSAARLSDAAKAAMHLEARAALVSLLRQNHAEITQRWVRRIEDQVGYQPDVDMNRKLVAAMIDHIRSHGDSSALVYAAQELVAKRHDFDELQVDLHTLQAAMQLFEDVCVEIFTSFSTTGTFSCELIPLYRCEKADVRKMITDVTVLANKYIATEYSIHAVEATDPRLPSWLLRPKDMPDMPLEECVKHINERLVGAKIADQYRLDRHIFSGGFGHGWKATDLHAQRDVFVKVYKTEEELKRGARDKMVLMVKELETSTRITKVEHLMRHPNIVAVLKVLRGVSIYVPRTGQKGTSFHGLVTQYCDGGDFFNYMTDITFQRCLSYSESQARFLFKQLVELLLTLHHPQQGEKYYHGDLKDDNLVLSGTTLKLIDYGSLTKVSGVTSPEPHYTPNFRQPFHNSCEAIDLWAVGCILLNMLSVGEAGQLTRLEDNEAQCVKLLKTGKLWDCIDYRLRNFPNHCLHATGPSSPRDLLQRILRVEPRNGISVREVADHPWLLGPVPSEQEMLKELRGRYKGILEGAPGTVFFDLGQPAARAEEILRHVADLACDSSGGDFVQSPDLALGGKICISRWQSPTSPVSRSHASGSSRWLTSASSMYYDEEWVTGQFECNIVHDPNGPRLRLCWVPGSGGTLEDFQDLSDLMANACRTVLRSM